MMPEQSSGSIAESIGLDRLWSVFTNRPQIGQIGNAVDVPPIPAEPVPGQTAAAAGPGIVQRTVQWIGNAVTGTWGYFVGVGQAIGTGISTVGGYIQGGGPGAAIGENTGGIITGISKPIWVTVLVVAVAAGIILVAAGKSGIFKAKLTVTR